MSFFHSTYSIAGDRSPFVTVGATDFGGGGGGASVGMVDAMVETGDAASTSSEYFIASSKVSKYSAGSLILEP